MWEPVFGAAAAISDLSGGGAFLAVLCADERKGIFLLCGE